MPTRRGMFYFLNWELFSPTGNFGELARGNEVLEVYIQDVDGCEQGKRYTFPITQAGQPFSLLKLNLLYQKDKCSKTLKDLLVSIRIVRGFEERLIYTSNIVLPAPHYADGSIHRIPIYRVWYYDEYLYMMFANQYSYM
jgi:hypothetical protein